MRLKDDLDATASLYVCLSVCLSLPRLFEITWIFTDSRFLHWDTWKSEVRAVGRLYPAPSISICLYVLGSEGDGLNREHLGSVQVA